MTAWQRPQSATLKVRSLPTTARDLSALLEGDPCWVASSTWDGEKLVRAEVERVTPSGRIRVRTSAGQLLEYGHDGDPRGAKKVGRLLTAVVEIDEMLQLQDLREEVLALVRDNVHGLSTGPLREVLGCVQRAIRESRSGGAP